MEYGEGEYHIALLHSLTVTLNLVHKIIALYIMPETKSYIFKY